MIIASSEEVTIIIIVVDDDIFVSRVFVRFRAKNFEPNEISISELNLMFMLFRF